MELTYTLEYRFARTPDGHIWTPDVYSRKFWDRYLRVFSAVRLIARVREIEVPQPSWKRVDGEGVTVIPLPYYVGPLQYWRVRKHVQAVLKEALSSSEAVLLRIPSEIANNASAVLEQTGKPYGVEVVSDPADAFAHGLKRLFRGRFVRHQRSQCSNSALALYVQPGLAKSYPSRHSVICSDAELGPAWFEPPAVRPQGRQILCIGSMENDHKGIDILLKALRGVDCALTIVGDGRLRPHYERQAAGLNVRFTGSIPPEQVRDELDRTNLFVLPSRTEGMPRALLEAMARGLPCLATSVGGIPNLLDPEDVVRPGDRRALAKQISAVLDDTSRQFRMRQRNQARVLLYREEVLAPLRDRAYRALLEQSIDTHAGAALR